MEDASAAAVGALRIGYVPGVQPDKWLVRWRERYPQVPVTARQVGDPRAGLARGSDDDDNAFDVIFFREAAVDPRSAPPGLLRVPLYTETMAVVAEKEHELAAFDTLTTADLDGERWLDPVDVLTATPDEVSAAVDLVAAGVGLLVLPQPYIRALSRRDVVSRRLEGVPATRMGVAWAAEREGEPVIDDFVGIVRGRSAATSRSGSESPAPKRTAREKAKAKAESRAVGGAGRRGRPASGGGADRGSRTGRSGTRRGR